MGQDYPLTRPSPGANPPIYPPFLPPARSGPPGHNPKGHDRHLLEEVPPGRIPKAMDFFSFSVLAAQNLTDWTKFTTQINFQQKKIN